MRSAATPPNRPSPAMAATLWVLLAMFVARVLGQLLVAADFGRFLPPWEEWYSGLLPYPWLLATQVLLVLIYGKICVDFMRGDGFFVRPRPAFGSGLIAIGSIYLVVMVLR